MTFSTVTFSPFEIAVALGAVPFVFGIVGREVVALGLVLKKKLSSNPKTIALCAVVDVAEDATTAAEEAVEANATKGVSAATLAGLQAALGVLKAEEGKLIDAADAEAKSLLVKQGLPGTSGNVTTNALKLLALLACLCVGGMAHAQTPAKLVTVSPPACESAATCADMAPYDFGLTLPALKFPWGGSTSVQVAGGAGFQGEANFFQVFIPNLGNVPVLSVGGAIFGSVQGSTTSPYAISLGPTVSFLHAFGLGITADLAAGGGTTPLSGLLPGRVSAANFAGLLFYNAQNLIDLL